MWNKHLHAVLTKMGFKCLQPDRCLYLYVRGDIRIILLVFVDDLTLAPSSKKALDDFVVELATISSC
jgi:hypothetical protein